MQNQADVIVVGAGIVGAACALKLQQQGRKVCLLEAMTPGSAVTAAGMGHLVVLDESPDELELCLYSLNLWHTFLDAHPEFQDVHRCGTLWVAENEDQLLQAQARANGLNQHAWNAELLTGSALYAAEPALRQGLPGAVRVTGDMVVYPPALAALMVKEMQQLGGHFYSSISVKTITKEGVIDQKGQTWHAPQVVVAAGLDVPRLVPDMPIFGRKGHLAITDRYPGTLNHQVVSMNYGQAQMSADALVVAANIQPRPTGQWLVGSCRQDQQKGLAIDPPSLAAVLKTAAELLPMLNHMRVIRAWAGMRPASPDGHPVIGQHPLHSHIWLAAGHEGLGVTTALATAEILVAQMMNNTPALPYQVYLPNRFFDANAHH